MIVLPNGMIAHIFITSLVQSDLGVWNMSGVGPELVRLLRNSVRQNGLFAALYGDGIFTPHLCLVPRYRNPNDRELRINMRFAPLRVYVEHTFRDFRNIFRFFNNFARMKLLFDGEMVMRIMVVGFFVLNCYYCFNNTSSRSFNLRAPTIEEYLPLDEVLPTDGEERDEEDGAETEPETETEDEMEQGRGQRAQRGQRRR